MNVANQKFSITLFLKNRLIKAYTYSEHQVVLIGMVGFIFFPLYYFVWSKIFPQGYTSLPLRLIGGVLCLGLLLKDYWPKKIQKLLPAYWYITMVYTLPFFSTFVTLKNNFSSVPLLLSMMSLFLLLLLVDWLSSIIIFTIGSSLALSVYILTNNGAGSPSDYIQYLFIFAFTMLAGTVFNRKTALLQRKKLEGMELLSRTIAHEMRTPLLSIRSGSMGLKRYLPILFESYEIARKHGLDVPRIRALHLNSLLSAADRIDMEANYANIIIDMLLTNIKREHEYHIIQEKLALLDMQECISETLERYPFSSEKERLIVHVDEEFNFKFLGVKILITHVLFNLVKNSIYSISRARKGEIFISLTHDNKFNQLKFKDTGAGVSAQDLPKLFDTFFTTSEMATGIGLAFCKLVMNELQGNIKCDSVEGEYTEFILSVPRL